MHTMSVKPVLLIGPNREDMTGLDALHSGWPAEACAENFIAAVFTQAGRQEGMNQQTEECEFVNRNEPDFIDCLCISFT